MPAALSGGRRHSVRRTRCARKAADQLTDEDIDAYCGIQPEGRRLPENLSPEIRIKNNAELLRRRQDELVYGSKPKNEAR